MYHNPILRVLLSKRKQRRKKKKVYILFHNFYKENVFLFIYFWNLIGLFLSQLVRMLASNFIPWFHEKSWSNLLSLQWKCVWYYNNISIKEILFLSFLFLLFHRRKSFSHTARILWKAYDSKHCYHPAFSSDVNISFRFYYGANVNKEQSASIFSKLFFSILA